MAMSDWQIAIAVNTPKAPHPRHRANVEEKYYAENKDILILIIIA